MTEFNTQTATALPVSHDTVIQQAGEIATDALFAAMADVEILCEDAFEHIEELDRDHTTQRRCAILRSHLMRIKAMNSLALSFFGPEDMQVSELYREVYGKQSGKSALQRALHVGETRVKPQSTFEPPSAPIGHVNQRKGAKRNQQTAVVA